MALMPCHECNREISSEAKACPHCGAPPKPAAASPRAVIEAPPRLHWAKRAVPFAGFAVVAIIVLIAIVDAQLRTPRPAIMSAVPVAVNNSISSTASDSSLPVSNRPRTPVACSQRDARAAAAKVQHDMRIMVEQTPITCIPTREASKQCGIVCVSEYRVGADQRTSILVWLMGVAGLEINARGVGKFSAVAYSDKDLLEKDLWLSAEASTLADLQKYVHDTEADPASIIRWSSALFRMKKLDRAAIPAR